MHPSVFSLAVLSLRSHDYVMSFGIFLNAEQYHRFSLYQSAEVEIRMTIFLPALLTVHTQMKFNKKE